MTAQQLLDFLDNEKAPKRIEPKLAEIGSIYAALAGNTIAYCENTEGNLVAVCWGRFYVPGVLHVSYIYCKTPKYFYNLVRHFMKLYPGCVLSGLRNNKQVVYNPVALERKFRRYAKL